MKEKECKDFSGTQKRKSGIKHCFESDPSKLKKYKRGKYTTDDTSRRPEK